MLRRVQYELAGRVAFPMLSALEAWQGKLKASRRKKGGGPFGPPLESVKRLKELMSHHYFQGRYADGAVPVAWVTSGFPVEVLRALGFHTVYPENHAALCGVSRLTPEYSAVAEARGYSRDLCSYVRTDLGSLLSGKTPVGRLPRPDLLCCCTNICQTVLYWYRSLSAPLGGAAGGGGHAVRLRRGASPRGLLRQGAAARAGRGRRARRARRRRTRRRIPSR